jgi:shikimate kinase
MELRPNPELSGHRIQLEPGTDTDLVRETLAVGLNRFAAGQTFSGELRIESQVPARKGLKSSSAVGGAVLRAISSTLRQSHPSEELARISADVAQEIGLSATGAYDDCLAALRGGLVLTDNTKRIELRAPPFSLPLRVVLWIPPESHATSTSLRDRFRAEAEAGQAAAEAARAGRWAEAMTLNTELVERVMGYDYGALRSELLHRGATMCGVSGMGPTLAVLAPAANVDAVVSALPSDRGEIRQTGLRPGDGGVGEGE